MEKEILRKYELMSLQIACNQILRDTKLPYEVRKIIEWYSSKLVMENITLINSEIPMMQLVNPV